MLVSFAVAPPVSYSHKVAPILALHCDNCHGDAGGLSTRSYRELMKGGNLGPVVVPGQPGRSLLVHFIDGRRGEAHRMPLGGRPLSTEQIAVISRWIAEGAHEDADRSPVYGFTLPQTPLGRGKTLRISCRVLHPAYLILSVTDGTRLLWKDVASVKSPKDPSDAGAPGDLIEWRVRPGIDWPEAVQVKLEMRYTEAKSKPAEFSATIIDAPDASP